MALKVVDAGATCRSALCGLRRKGAEYPRALYDHIEALTGDAESVRENRDGLREAGRSDESLGEPPRKSGGRAAMSLLTHLMDGWRPEGAATRALAHILDRRTCPGMADAFVKLIGPAGVPAFPANRVEHEASRSDDSRPDITIRDADGKSRVLVATTFWNGVHDSQPVSCLRELPEAPPSALVFIAPRERIRELWSELRTRCQDSPGFGLRDESSRTGDPAWARAGRHVLMIASWQYVLDALPRQAADPGVEQDIDELLGLV
ncbi:MAG: hypothetical protein OXI15_01915, partial [Chromatiales bacterium]|nr:hypothetical protein [Chromatiales bacterium]